MIYSVMGYTGRLSHAAAGFVRSFQEPTSFDTGWSDVVRDELRRRVPSTLWYRLLLLHADQSLDLSGAKYASGDIRRTDADLPPIENGTAIPDTNWSNTKQQANRRRNGSCGVAVSDVESTAGWLQFPW